MKRNPIRYYLSEGLVTIKPIIKILRLNNIGECSMWVTHTYYELGLHFYNLPKWYGARLVYPTPTDYYQAAGIKLVE